MILNRMISIFRRQTLLQRYHNAMEWIKNNTISGKGIVVSSRERISYPEVTGYFIPTLLSWGRAEEAEQFARWLVSIQNQDGSWSDPAGISPYTFDTGQILKGLLALVERHPEFEGSILKGCRWLTTQVNCNGRVTTPDISSWGLPGGKVVPEAIHLYALEPLQAASRLWGIPSFNEVVERAVDYYAGTPNTLAFTTLSHFHAYIAEALVDLGRRETAIKVMDGVSSQQHGNGFIPAYPGGKWACSTGLFQYAVTWYKLGKFDEANRAFRYGVALQNSTGGFYGGYGSRANYFPREEISWAVKYFLDALKWKIRTDFDMSEQLFPSQISRDDGRYRLVFDTVGRSGARTVLDAGCGKGRFLRHLATDFPTVQLCGLDVSEKMLAHLPETVARILGGLLDISAADESFDLVFTVEALEHAVDIPRAVRELSRVVAPGGTLVIIDKNREYLGRLKIAEWEQWFDAVELANILRQNGFAVSIERNLPCDGRDGSDRLFIGWVATKK